MKIALRKRTLSPVGLVLEDSSKHSFMLLVVVVVSLQLGSIIQSNLILRLHRNCWCWCSLHWPLGHRACAPD